MGREVAEALMDEKDKEILETFLRWYYPDQVPGVETSSFLSANNIGSPSLYPLISYFYKE